MNTDLAPPAEPAVVWAVVFSNYDPAEVAALYDNEAAAQAHVNDQDDDRWTVARWPVASVYRRATA